MKRRTKAVEQDSGLWKVYLDGNMFIGVIYDRGAKVQGIPNAGYDLLDSWDVEGPGHKLGEARRFPTAVAFLWRRFREQLAAPIRPQPRIGVPQPVIDMDSITPMTSRAGRKADAAKEIAAMNSSVLNKSVLPDYCSGATKPAKTYRMAAGRVCHHEDQPRLLTWREPIYEIPQVMRYDDRPTIKATLDSWFPNWRVYQGDSSSGEDDQWIWRFPNDLGLSVLVRKREDAVYAAMVRFYPDDDSSVAKHSLVQKRFKIVNLACFNRDDYTNYWNNLDGPSGLMEFLERIKNADGRSWEPDPHWEEHNKRCLGAPLVKAAFEGIIKGGTYWLSGYDCWLASCYSIRYPEDLKGFQPVAAYSRLNEGRYCEQWLVLTKDGQFHVDYRNTGEPKHLGYGISPLPAEEQTYPPEVYDWIFQTVMPAVVNGNIPQSKRIKELVPA